LFDRIIKAYKPYAEAFLREESKGFDGEHFSTLYCEKGDAGIREFLKDKN
jgi:hypothetical protein